MKHIVRFFDRMEDVARIFLSHRPIIYAFIGGVGVVLFWRGVWHVGDLFAQRLGVPFAWDGALSMLAGGILLLVTGLFVSIFIGDQVIISGLRGEKKITEKTEKEVEIEEGMLGKMHGELHKMTERLQKIEKRLKIVDHSKINEDLPIEKPRAFQYRARPKVEKV